MRAERPSIDQNTYKGKLMILKNVDKGIQKLPKDFPTIKTKAEEMISKTSTNYQSTHERRNSLMNRHLKTKESVPCANMILDNDFGIQPSFRRTARVKMTDFE